jgi:hypothetical protein
MFRPMIQAPIFSIERSANPSSTPVLPPFRPVIVWNIRVLSIQSGNAIPRSPKGLSMV